MKRVILLTCILITWLFVKWRVDNVEAQSLAFLNDDCKVIALYSNGHDRANAIAFSPDGHLLVAGTSTGIYIFDTSTCQKLHFISTSTWVRSLAFSPDGKTLVTGSYDPIVRLWRVEDANLLQEWQGHTGWIRSISFSSDGQSIVSASDDNTVRVWRVIDGKPILIINHGTEGVRTAAFSPDGENVATAGFDKIIRIWRISDGALLSELKGHTDWVRTVTYSPDGKLLASGGFDATVRLWRVEDGALLQTMQGHQSSVLSVAFSKDGKYLTSGSVDTSVRLWQIPSGKLLDILSGHSDFVFSVAFSPDGKYIASGGVDNSIHLWNISNQQEYSVEAPGNEVPSNCVSCHHPQANLQPARVIEVSCLTCHSNGSLVKYWCPAFTRSGGSSAVSVISQFDSGQLGLPSPNENLAVTIGTYGNGEHIYSQGNVITLVPITGKVDYSAGDVKEVKIQLEINAGNTYSKILYTEPSIRGDYYFNFILNPQGGEPPELLSSADGWRRSECLSCHDTQLTLLPSLPAGDIKLTVTATAPNGEKAEDTRWITVDEPRTVTIPVEASLADSQSIANIPIQAFTYLYQWRGRTFKATSDDVGQANIEVEALSEHSTTYQISIPPVVVDGMQYESEDNVSVTLPSLGNAPYPIKLQVQASTGRITGSVTGLNAAVHVWAIRLADGEAFTATTSPQGEFIFTDLPVTQFMLVADPWMLAEQGLFANSEVVDLVISNATQLSLITQPLKGGISEGRIKDETGNPLPFAWISFDNQIVQNDPISGEFSILDLPVDKTSAVISAPGYFASTQKLSFSSDEGTSTEINLIRRPETRLISWGDGQIVIPPETIYQIEGQTITFEQGWLWGRSESLEPLIIKSGEFRISISDGSFALERIPAQSGWLYLLGGSADIISEADDKSIMLQSGEMVRLNIGQAPQPVKQDQMVVSAIHSNNENPITPVWQPDLLTRINDQFARIGIGTVQTITFITYILEVLFLLTILILSVNWLIQKTRKEKKSD